MAKGLDELIDWLVAETAYCGETADFVAAVSRFFDGPKPDAGRSLVSSSNNDGIDNNDSNTNSNDIALARKAWDWLTERPEIRVGFNGCYVMMTLDEALAPPEPASAPEPMSVDDMDGIKIEEDDAPTITLARVMPKKVAPKTRGGASRGRMSTHPSAENPDPAATQPRLFATEETIWHALTGHDVDHKRVPPLEWKCLMGIASARANGILQGDLRVLVNQDKRSVPKRTDFLTSKGYVVKRTTIARGFRTSMLWLTDFAPAELDVDAGSAMQQQQQQQKESSTSLADTAGIDLSPDFLRRNLDPVPWRNRWIGDAIEFASFGQTILAIVKAWDVIRVVDLKHKLGIVGQRWQMRTLARACREFVESGILRFVAAMRADEPKLFKDCIKYERDPTPHEWTVYLAAGRRRAPITEVRARHRRDQERRITAADDVDVDDDPDDANLDDDAFDLDAAAAAATDHHHSLWQPGVPLLNLVFDTVARAGTAGITSPELCRLTVGARYARYMFSLVTALSKPGSQPPHLARFQLHCEPDRVGKNKAYLFRTRANHVRAMKEADEAEDEAGEPASSPPLDNVQTQHALSLHERGELARLPASEVRRLLGFTAAPVPLSAGEALDRLNDVMAEQRPAYRPPTGRPRMPDSALAAPRKPVSKNKGKMGGRRGRPPKRKRIVVDDDDDDDVDDDDDEVVPVAKRLRGGRRTVEVKEEDEDVSVPSRRLRGRPRVEADEEGVEEEAEDVVVVPKRPRGRPRRVEPEEVEEDEEADAEHTLEPPEDTPNEPSSPTLPTPGKRGRGRPPKRRIAEDDDVPVTRRLRGRPRRAEPEPEEEEEEEPDAEEPTEAEPPEERIAAADDDDVLVTRRLRGRPRRSVAKDYTEAEPADTPDEAEETETAALTPIPVLYHGTPGTLAVNRADSLLVFTPIRRRGRRKANEPPPATKEPIAMDVAKFVSDPVIRSVPGTDDKKEFVIEVDDGYASVSAYTFVFSGGGDDDDDDAAAGHADLLLRELQQLRANADVRQMRSGTDVNVDAAPASTAAPALAAAAPAKPGRRAKAKKDLPFVCDKCGNTWKNPHGLQYHQTKARTPCNPDYAAYVAAPVVRKEKVKASAVIDVDSSGDGGDGDSDSENNDNDGANDDNAHADEQQVPADSDVDIDAAPASPVPASPAPPRRRGRAKGPAKPKQGPPFVCDTCGNTWKNPHGLQYHQTKARTPCNPDYAAYMAAPMARKKKAVKTNAVIDVDADADADAAGPSRSRLRPRKRISFADMDIDVDNETDAEASDAASDAEVVSDGETLPPPKKAAGADRTFRRLFETEAMASGPVPSFRGIAGASRVSSTPRKLQPLPPPPPPRAVVEATPVPRKTPETKRTMVQFPTDRAATAAAPTPRVAPETAVSRPETPSMYPSPTPATYPSPTPARDMLSSVPSAASTPFKSVPMPAALAASASSGTSTPAPFRMPPLARKYDKASIFILRTLRTVEIIRYLVSCYDDGVFPSDRSLWYACFSIYTQTFPGQDPPTLNVTKAALKKLELAKVLEEHTFGFRDARGQFIYCRLVARPGTELFQSPTATEMKRNIQAAYPKPFVPAEFAPSAHDMAVLRIMDKEFGKETPKNVRGRRTLAPEIEVLKAPVYERPTPTRTATKTVLVLGSDDDADGNGNPNNGGGARGRSAKKAKGTPGRKRKAGPDRGGFGDDDYAADDFAGALTRVSNGQSSSAAAAAAPNANNTTPGTTKKRRARFADFIAGKAEARWARRRDADYDGSDDMDDYADDYVDATENVSDDPDANIDPLLRDSSTMRIRNKPGPRPKNKSPVNPGLDTLPDYFYTHAASTPSWSGSVQPSLTAKTAFCNTKNRPAHLRAVGPDGHATFVHFLPPNTSLGEGENANPSGAQLDGDLNGNLDNDLRSEYSAVTPQRQPFARPRAYKIVTKMFTLEDNRRARGGATTTGFVSWPSLTETVLQRHSDSSVTMDGFMPTAKALVRANLPRSPAECASLLRKNHVLAGIAALVAHDDNNEQLTAAERMLLDIDYCRAWEHSQPGRDLLSNASVAPTYVFLSMAFAGAHTTVRSDDYVQAGSALWVPENQYTMETLPYVALADEEVFGEEHVGLDSGVGAAATESESPAQSSRARNAAAAIAQRSRDTLAQRDRQARQARQAKYVMSSRRAMTAYPAEGECLPRETALNENENDWNSDETLMAAFIAVRTLLGGLGHAVDWGLLMRLFPDRKLSALRAFWTAQRKRKQVYIDKYTERFQTDFLEAYDRGTLPPLDYDDVVAYDWPRLVRWTVHMIRHSAAVTLPATRAALEDQFAIVDMVATAAAAAPSASSTSSTSTAPQTMSASLQQASAPAVPSWREDYFHAARSLWKRLQDSASEAAYQPIEAAGPTTPAEAAAAMAAGRPGARDALRFMVARSWIRALCGTPHDRYKPAVIKEQLLRLRDVGATGASKSDNEKRDEATTNVLLQSVIGNLTQARILRRSKSMVAVSGRMYQMAEVYETTLDKAAMESKFRQAWAFKSKLDEAFRRGEAVELPAHANDDGMIMALINLQAHGRVALEAVDAPHVPFGFEPGNYETRKFPKHYQRFQQRIVPRAYVYNEDMDFDGLNLDDLKEDLATRHGEKPIWRDFFGILDRQWFTRLLSAVVFSLATRGATLAAQTAAHLRPVIEPFEVLLIMAWATRAGILKSTSGSDITDITNIIDTPPDSAAVTEWWWLLIGKMFTAVEERKPGRSRRARAVVA